MLDTITTVLPLGIRRGRVAPRKILSMKMLIVDDDSFYRTLVRGFARELNFEPIVAADGEEGWELYNAHHPAFVLLDWAMPRLTGVDLCRRIRSVPVRERPYIILVTTLSADERVLEGFDAGADEYVVKPLDRKLFGSLVRGASARVRFGLQQEDDLHRQLIAKYQNALGHERPELLDSMEALSRLSRQQRAYSKARAFLRRQIDVATKMGDQVAVRRFQLLVGELKSLERAARTSHHPEATGANV